MNFLRVCLAVGFCFTATGTLAAKPKHILFFTKSAGFEHDVIRVKDGQPSHAEKVVQAVATRAGFTVTHSKDGGLFTAVGLAPFDGFLFFTSGDLTTAGTDKERPMPPGGKQLLLDQVRAGKGFVGFHAASDTFLSPPPRHRNNGDDTDPFIKMLGGEFIVHGSQQKARVFCPNPKFPGLAACNPSVLIHEEWYSLKNLAPDLHVLMWIATWDMKNSPGGESGYRRGPYPVTWTRQHGKGRVYFSALGHRADVWDSTLFQDMMAGAVAWTTGTAKAKTPPNVSQLTPFYRDDPPER